ncbi:MAG: UDP-3-O-acyl-N-acetylglucosamine deacetylase [Synechococcus sp.]
MTRQIASSFTPSTNKSCQQTLASPVKVSGIGLHSGEIVNCHLHPAPIDSGKFFVRTDLSTQPTIRASLEAAIPAQLSTLLQQGEANVRTIEHLMAALVGCGVDNCRIDIDGSEVPILDGSAKPWVGAIQSVGLIEQDGVRPLVKLEAPVTIWDGEAFVTAVPSPVTRYSYGIDFANSPIGEQWFSWTESPDVFAEAIAPARTFTTEANARLAQQAGLIKGGSLDNAIVCTDTEWLTPLRFENEPVRHKLIDLLGDLSLTGRRWQAHFIAYKASHTLHGRFAKELLDVANRFQDW